MALQIVRFTWPNVATLVQQVVPPLTYLEHKGSMGRIGVIGGSVDYCGAPYYAAMSAIKLGADLSWVYSSQAAAMPIKSYSPELIVTPFYDDNNVLTMNSSIEPERFKAETTAAIDVIANSPRVHVFLVGPGMGRNPNVVYIVGNIVHSARVNQMPLVIDADGLWLIAHNLSLIMGCTNCILTPNKVEFERLIDAAIDMLSARIQQQPTAAERGYYTALLSELCLVEPEGLTSNSSSFHSANGARSTSTCTSNDVGSQSGVGAAAVGRPSSHAVRRVQALSAALGGVTVMRKGAMDIIASSTGTYLRSAHTATAEDTVSGSGKYTDDPSVATHTTRHSGDDHSQGAEEEVVYVVEARGAPRRCGGLGDILSGTTATALHWALQQKDTLSDLRAVARAPEASVTTVQFDHHFAQASEVVEAEIGTSNGASNATNGNSSSDSNRKSDSTWRTRNAAVQACVLASVVTKQATALAFAAHSRSMTAPDVLAQIGNAFQIVHPEE